MPSVRGLRVRGQLAPRLRKENAPSHSRVPKPTPRVPPSANAPTTSPASSSLHPPLRTGVVRRHSNATRSGMRAYWEGSSPSRLRCGESSCGLRRRWEAWPSPSCRVGGRWEGEARWCSSSTFRKERSGRLNPCVSWRVERGRVVSWTLNVERGEQREGALRKDPLARTTTLVDQSQSRLKTVSREILRARCRLLRSEWLIHTRSSRGGSISCLRSRGNWEGSLILLTSLDETCRTHRGPASQS